MGCKTWTNVPGIFSIEVERFNGIWHDMDGEAMPDAVQKALADCTDDYYELVIGFRSSGYSDPGVLSGPPERCYPPEGEDERVLDYVELDRGPKILLESDAAQPIFDAFEEDIIGMELDADWRD